MSGGKTLSPEALRQAAALKQGKAALRQAILARRDATALASRSHYSQIIMQRLSAAPAYRAANVIAAYVSFGSEPDTSEFLATVLADGKQLLLPRINRAHKVLELRRVIDPGADLVAGVWGIREPLERCPIISCEQVECILVPGVAFTARGARLGYGGGFYDRLLASVPRRAARIAAAFDLQMVDQLPEAAHDQRVDQVITQT